MGSMTSPQGIQQCSETDCDQPAAFRTRTRASWCDVHITAILRQGDVEALEPFTTLKAPRCIRIPNGALRIRRSDYENWLTDCEGAA
ncbi:hypothetical protein [Streptomyces sp. YIM 130001]|uniref:hypothetical protein n=1 Tax=Streptomyces sp. YIM 130001 TaxID=2259644 RepID=UPI001F09251B|nr:hypothetical protein [Streptomyces sp. YIM 130001]